MPGMTGVELIERLRRKRSDIPAILSTGHEGAIEPEELNRVRVDRLVQKPASPQKMAQVIHEVLRECKDRI